MTNFLKPKAFVTHLLQLQQLKQNNRTAAVLGLDVSTNNIGIAVSDATLLIANPALVIDRRSLFSEAEALEIIHQTANKYKATGIVIGLPIQLDLTLGKTAEQIKSFSSLIRGIPYTFWDESFTTKIAFDAIHGGNEGVRDKRSRNRKTLTRFKKESKAAPSIDAIAASVMLQSFLDFYNSK